MPPQASLLVVSGPGGVGKDTVVRHLRSLRPDLAYALSYTSRPPRPGEVDGVDYHFVDRLTFQSPSVQHDLLEQEQIAGHLYGASRRSLENLLATGNTVAMILDVNGAASLKQQLPAALTVFMHPPSLAELEARLRRRGDAEAEIRDRLAIATIEIARAREFDLQVTNHDAAALAAELARYLQPALPSPAPRDRTR